MAEVIQTSARIPKAFSACKQILVFEMHDRHNDKDIQTNIGRWGTCSDDSHGLAML